MSLLTDTIGGDGGSEFEFNGIDNGAILEKIGVWVGPFQVKALSVQLSDGQTKEFGIYSDSYPYSEFKFDPGEFFTSLSLWGNGKGSRLGAIKFKTNKERNFFAKMTQWELKTECPMDIGSGVCLGVEGRAGADIDSLGFVFINSIKSVVMKDVTYPTLHHMIPNVNVEEIKSISYRNSSTVEEQHTLETASKITRTSSWSTGSAMESAYNMSIQAAIPEFNLIDNEFSLTLGTPSTYELESSDEKTENLIYIIKVPPGKSMDVRVTFGRADIHLPYKATVEVTCIDGTTYQYEKSGIYKGVAYTNAKVDMQEVP
ncbi:AEP1 protein, partial [Polypterus senegalus]|nr:aerolysin-like protein [Polypterus senegalus]MBN3291895.1 AEP1 protein [Polypterus senegalus]